MRALVDEGAVEAPTGASARPRRSPTCEIPGTIHEVVQARVDGLERGTAAAPADGVRDRRDASTVDVLAAVVGDDERVADGSSELLDAEFLVPSDRLPGRGVRLQAPADPGGHLRRACWRRAARSCTARSASAIEATLADETARLRRHARLPLRQGRRSRARRGVPVPRGRGGGARRGVERGAALLRGGRRPLPGAPRRRRDPAKRARSRRRSPRRSTTAAASSTRSSTSTWRSRCSATLRAREREQLLGFARDLVAVLRRLYLPLRRRRRAGDRARARDHGAALRARRGDDHALPTRHVFDSMRSVALLQRIDPRSVPRARRCTPARRSLFAFGGISFDVSRRLAALAHGWRRARRLPSGSTSAR